MPGKRSRPGTLGRLGRLGKPGKPGRPGRGKPGRPGRPGRPGWPAPQAGQAGQAGHVGQAGQAGQGRPKAARHFRAQVHHPKTMADSFPNGFIWAPFCPDLDQATCQPRCLHLARFCLCQIDVLGRGSKTGQAGQAWQAGQAGQAGSTQMPPFGTFLFVPN